MKLSIIIPVYNTEKYLKDCLDSITRKIKNRDDIEIILVDDGSTDNSHLIYSSYNYKHLKKFKTENSGISCARNFGIKKSSGEWIMFVDSDDKLVDDWINVVEKYLTENKDLIIFNKLLNKNCNKKQLYKEIIGISECNCCIASSCAKLYRKSIILNNNIFFNKDLINGEDMFFNLEILRYIEKYLIVNESIYLYRINPASSTHVFNEKIFDSDRLFHQLLKKNLEFTEFNEKEKEFISSFCKKGAIKLILLRISKLANYKLAKKYFSFLDIEPYKDIMLKNKDTDFINYLCYKKRYWLIYRFMKFKTFIKNIIKKKEYYNEI